MPDLAQHLASRIRGSAETVASLADLAPQIAAAASAIADCLSRGGTVYTCGNGGSAAEALHLAEEMTGKYRDPRPPMRAVCLNGDPTALTCIANDFGYDQVFARQAQAFCRENDVLVAFTTSGNSDNIKLALETARAHGALTVGLLGKGGGACRAHCDHALVVASDDTAHIQEAHQVVLHLFLETFEASAPAE